MHSRDFPLLAQIGKTAREVNFLYDPVAHQIQHISEGLEAFMQCEPKDENELICQLKDLIFPEDLDYVEQQLNLLSEKEPFISLEFRISKFDKSLRWVYAKVHYLINEEGKPVVLGFAEDINERKEYELSLFNIKERKDTVLQILGHDLRAPLSTISMSANLLGKATAKQEGDKVKRFTEIINTTSQNALNLIQNILETEYLQAEHVKLKKIRVELLDRIANQIDTYKINDQRKQFSLNHSHNAIYANIDVAKFMLVIENILSNAYKFTDLDGKIDIYVEKKQDTILMSVEDDGIGIPENLQPLIFDKFTQARRTGNRGERATGLGMHLIKKMVELHDGDIWFESKENVGTTFFVEIPDATSER